MRAGLVGVPLCVAFIGWAVAEAVAAVDTEPRRHATTASTASPADAAGKTTRPSVAITRILPVPPDAQMWPKSWLRPESTVSRNDDIDGGLVLADLRDVHDVDGVLDRHPKTGRRLRERIPYRDVDAFFRPPSPFSVAVGDVRDRDAGDRDTMDRGVIDRGVNDRDDEAPTSYSVWESAGLDDDDARQPPISLGAVGDVALDADYPHGPHRHHDVKTHSVDGRGPVVVRGPPFNSVAIGFLIYLILLTVLQNSIFNMTNKQNLLSLGVGLRPARDRERRETDDIDVDVNAVRSEEGVSVTGLPATLLKPVLVAAVLDADADSGRDQVPIGGPRRASRRVPETVGSTRRSLHNHLEKLLPPPQNFR